MIKKNRNFARTLLSRRSRDPTFLKKEKSGNESVSGPRFARSWHYNRCLYIRVIGSRILLLSDDQSTVQRLCENLQTSLG